MNKMNKLQIWLMAIRPKTLSAAISPVMIATAMAFGDGVYDFYIAFLCLVGALLIQIGTNLANDYFDFKKGADTNERIGPTRVSQAGLIKPQTMVWTITIIFGLSIFICYLLILQGGWIIAVIGVLSILSGIFYTAGPRPLGYLGLGEIFVLIFFGPIAVSTTYYLQSLEINMAVFLSGFAPGLLSMAILGVNNLRDIDSDRKSNKNTLAVRFGRSFALTEYLICIFTASIIPVLIYALIEDHLPIISTVIIPLLAIPSIKMVLTKIDGPSLNQALANTGKLLFLYSLLFSIGWIL